MNLDEIRETKKDISFHLLRLRQLIEQNQPITRAITVNFNSIEILVEALTKQTYDVTKRLSIIRAQLETK